MSLSEIVGVRHTADGIESTGISYDDLRGMHFEKKGTERGKNRRLETPEWALSDEKLRAVLARFTELRAGYITPRAGTVQERLERAQKYIVANEKFLIARLDSVCKKYVEAKNSGQPESEIKQLQIEIESIDTQIRFSANGFADKALSIAYLYHRCRQNSVEVAEALSLKPPHVRMVLWRLKKSWERLQAEEQSKSTEHRATNYHPHVDSEISNRALYKDYGVVTVVETKGTLTKILTNPDDEFSFMWVKTSMLKRARHEKTGD